MSKRKIITRLLMGLVGVVLIIILILIETSYSESNKFYYEQVRKVREEHDLSGFLKANAKVYKEINETETDDYFFALYHVITEEGTNEFYNNVLMVAVLKSEELHATNKQDINDQTTFTIGNLFNSKTSETYQDFPLSFGYSDNQIGFIYLTYKFENNLDETFTYINYEGIEVINIDFLVNYIDYDESNTYAGYSRGYTTEELSDLINYQKIVVRKSMIYTSIFLVILITSFGVLDFIKKRN